MPNANIDTGPIKIIGSAECVAKPGSVRLDGYSLLVYDGRGGIKTEDNGTTVLDVVESLAANPSVYATATRFATTVNHVNEALRYAFAVGLAQATGAQ